MPLPALPVLGAVANFITVNGARRATIKYGPKAVKEAQKQIAKRQKAIANRQDPTTPYSKGSQARSAETAKVKAREKRLEKERMDKDYFDIDGEPLDEVPLRFDMNAGGLLSDDRASYGAGQIVKKTYKALKKQYENHVKNVVEDYGDEYKISNAPSKTRKVTPEEAKKILKVVENYEIPFGGTEGTLDRLFQYELEMVAAGKKPQELNHWWFAVDDSIEDSINTLTPNEGLELALNYSKRQQKSIGGLITKLFKLAKKKKPKEVKEQDIDKILDSLSDEQMEKLTPIEIEQLLDMDLAKSGVDNIPAKSTKKDIDDILDNLTDKEIENLTPVEREQLLDMEIEKYGIDGRKTKNYGGLLSDDRQAYGVGSLVKKMVRELPDKIQDMKDERAFKKSLKRPPRELIRELEADLDDLIKKRNTLESREIGGEAYNDDYVAVTQEMNEVIDMLNMLGVKPSRKNLQEKSRTTKAHGGMLPDEDMEDNYTKFIMEEALTEDEEDMLASKLEQDEELAMIFDKVIEVAQEFAGSGPVEGPGSGVSDSIPARLSDGEFVFTAKAVEEIGESELMRMMKDAEAAADERQGFAEGEKVEQESKSLLSSGIMQEDEIAEDELKKRMVQGSSDYVRS